MIGLKAWIEMKIMKGLIDSVVMKELITSVKMKTWIILKGLIGHIFSGRNERNESGFH